jgi:hypothetical protein
LEAALRPFVDLCVAWSGGIMLGAEEVDAGAYQRAMELVARNELPEIGDAFLSAPETWVVDEKDLVRLTADTTVPAGFLKMLARGRAIGTLIFPLTFPEVFYPNGEINNPNGFDVVLANPPWDKILPFAKEFFAGYEFSVVSAPTKRERTKIEKQLLSDAHIRQHYESYIGEFRAIERCIEMLYSYQKVEIDGESTIGKQDAFRLFVERVYPLLCANGYVGVVVPSAFHANEGATGVRQLYFAQMAMRNCFSFENKLALFDIHRSFKFAIITAQKSNEGTGTFDAAFYLHDDAWLFSANRIPAPISYSREFVARTGLEYLNLLELRTQLDYEIASACYLAGKPFGKVCEGLSMQFGREMNMTDDSERFILAKQVTNGDLQTVELAEKGFLTVYEGKFFHQFTDRWEEYPRYVVELKNIANKTSWLEQTRFYRAIFRDVASSTNEQTAIFAVLPPGTLCGKGGIEKDVLLRSNATMLALVAAANTFGFDYTARLKVQSTLNLFILNSLPFPPVENIRGFLSHSTLRLVCNHSGYALLWQEQLGDAWRESVPVGTYPVLAGEDARWEVRSAIDAAVAQAYGLSREQYAHVLSTFSHKSYPKAPSLCLAKFDELLSIGLEAFVRRYDPYWDVALVESLPSPVIELPKIEMKVGEEQAYYGAKDMFGNSLATDMFGNVVSGKKRKGRR